MEWATEIKQMDTNKVGIHTRGGVVGVLQRKKLSRYLASYAIIDSQTVYSREPMTTRQVAEPKMQHGNLWLDGCINVDIGKFMVRQVYKVGAWIGDLVMEIVNGCLISSAARTAHWQMAHRW